MRLFVPVIIVLSFFIFIDSVFASVRHIGQAAVVRGDVYVERSTEKLPLKARDNVYEGDKILTGEKGKVQIIFADNTIFTIGREAEILLDKYVYDPATHDGVSEIKAKKGTFKFVTGKIAKKNPKHVKVKTPFATIGVRGSGGIVDVAGNGATTVGLTNCCLDLFANGAPAGTPPVPLDSVNSFSQVNDPATPPTIPAPMPPEMVQQMNGDLAGGFAPVEGEGMEGEGGEQGNNPAPEGTEEGAQEGEGDNPPPPEGTDEGQAPADEGTNPPPQEGGNQPPLEGEQQPTAGNAQPLPPLAGGLPIDGESANFGGSDGLAGFGTFDGNEPLLADGEPLIGGGDGFTTGGDSFFNPDGAGPVIFDEPAFVDVNIDIANTTQDGTNADIIDNSTGGAVTHTGIFKRKVSGEGFIREGDLSGSLVGGQFIGDFVDFDTTTFSGALPIPATAGDFNQPDFSFGGVLFNGRGYKSLNSDFLLYDLDSTNGDELYLAAGTQISVPTSGINNFEFRNDPFSSGSSSSSSSDGSLVMDWGRQKFIGGNIEIFNDEANTDYRYSVTVGFGDILSTPNAAGTNTSGLYYDFEAEQIEVNSNDKLFSAGTANVKEVFGTGSEVSGFILDINKEIGNLPTGSSSNDNEYTINPAVRLANDSTTIDAGTAFTAAKTYNGFVGGYIMNVATNGSIDSFDRISNHVTSGNIVGGMEINLSHTGTATANLQAWDDGSRQYEVDFGTVGTISAALNDRAYAIQQSASAISISTVSSLDDGALISDALADTKCTACEFAHWGVWTGKLENTDILGGANTAIAGMVPYIAGDLTDGTTLNSFTGTATYTGMTIGSVLENGTTLSHHTGDFGATVDFSTRQVTAVSIGLDTFTATQSAASSTWTGSQNGFNIPLNVSGGGTGSANGAFFGPNAQDIGGNFEFSGTGYTAAGVYLGNDASR